MEFNSDRFLALAGIPSEKANILSEGKQVVAEADEVNEEALAEAMVRTAIRNEIEAIVQEMRVNGDSDWLYRGMRKPRRSRGGQVTMGLLGIGFGDVGE